MTFSETIRDPKEPKQSFITVDVKFVVKIGRHIRLFVKYMII